MNSIAAQLNRIKAESMQKVEKIYRGSMLEMGRRIILRSPVRDGFFKANWNSDYMLDNSYNENNADPNKSDGRLVEKVNGLSVEKKFYFANSMPYAFRLENGWSQQAPMGMVKVTAAEWRDIANAEIQKNR